MISRRRIVDSIISSVNELEYRVRDKAQLPGIVQELVSTCLAIEGQLKAIEREDGRGLEGSTREERLVHILRNYQRFKWFVSEIESAIGPASRKLQQDETIRRITRIKNSLDSIREVVKNNEKTPVLIDRLYLHISHLYEEQKRYKRLLSQISLEINNGSYDFKSLPDIVAGLAVKTPKGDDQDHLGTGRDAETGYDRTGFVNEPNVQQLQAEMRRLEEKLETSRNTIEEERQQVEIERRNWATVGEQHQTEMFNLKKKLREMEESHEEKVDHLEAQRRQDIDDLNIGHNKTTAEMKETHDSKLRDALAYAKRIHDKAVGKLNDDHSAKEKELENSVAAANTTIQELRDENESTIAQMQTLHETAKKNLEKDYREREGDLQTQRDAWKSKHAQEVKTAKEILQQQKARLNENHEREKVQTETKHKEQVSTITRQHEAALGRSATTHAQRTAELQSKFEAEQRSLATKIKQLKDDLQKARDDTERVEKNLKAKILKQMKDYEKDMEIQQKANEETTAAQQKLHEEATAAQTKLHEQELRDLIEAHQTELASQIEQYTNLLANADARHEDRKQELLILQDRLQKRDNHVALTDSEIVEGRIDDGGDLEVHGMAMLLAEVKKFAAWSWRDDREIWPQDVMFALAGDKQKRLRKLILGDMIWTVLFHVVFCSPFRLLGEIGKKLEHDWSQNFGEGIGETADSEYVWPRATLDSEKWRYDTCQDALRSLTKPTTEFSDDGRLKKSFFNNRKVIRKQLFESIGRLVELDKEQEAELDVFILNAVRTWLCFGTQRYRLQMFMTGSADLDQEKKMDLVQKGDLMFTVAPRLRRIGNSRGTELDEVCTVSGCAGSRESAQS